MTKLYIHISLQSFTNCLHVNIKLVLFHPGELSFFNARVTRLSGTTFFHINALSPALYNCMGLQLLSEMINLINSDHSKRNK